MAERFTRRFRLLAIALLAMAATACVEPLHPYGAGSDARGAYLPVSIYLPEMPASTKASAGPVTALAAESALHDLQIWAYTHQAADATAQDSEGPVSYLCLPSISETVVSSGEIDVTLRIPDYVMIRPDSLLLFDFYVLANGSSVGIDPGISSASKLTRGDLKAKTFGEYDGSGFGKINVVRNVPDGGLPMSCFFNNGGTGFDLSFLKLDFKTDQLTYVKNHHGRTYDAEDTDYIDLGLTAAQQAYLASHCVTDGVWNWYRLSPLMTLTRAVSKLRFVFAKTTGQTNVGVTSVEVVDFSDESGLIPESTYVFPRETSGSIALPGTSYLSVAMGSDRLPLLNSEAILADSNPSRLRSNSTVVDPYFGPPAEMTVQQYNDFLTWWMDGNTSTEKLLYLRESDKPIRGRINYWYGDNHDYATFDMTGVSGADFSRNHAWTVFAYFSYNARRLEVETVVLPWDDKVDGSVGRLEPVIVDQDGKLAVDLSTAVVDNFRVTVPASGAAVARVAIYGPDGGQLIVTPSGDTDAFTVTITDKNGNMPAGIDKIDHIRDGGRMYIRVARSASAASGKQIQLSFSVKLPSGRVILADSEIIDDNYTFVIP